MPKQWTRGNVSYWSQVSVGRVNVAGSTVLDDGIHEPDSICEGLDCQDCDHLDECTELAIDLKDLGLSS